MALVSSPEDEKDRLEFIATVHRRRCYQFDDEVGIERLYLLNAGPHFRLSVSERPGQQLNSVNHPNEMCEGTCVPALFIVGVRVLSCWLLVDLHRAVMAQR